MRRSPFYSVLLACFAGLALCVGCTWSPKVFHPGLANAGAGLGQREDVEFGLTMHYSVFMTPFARMEFRLLDRLTLSGGFGMTGLDLGGPLVSLNWVAVEEESFYLTLSPNLVLHQKEEFNFSGRTVSFGITPGVKVGILRAYLVLMPGYYHGGPFRNEDGSEVGDGGKGGLMHIGAGLSIDTGVARIYFEGHASTVEMVGPTWVMPVVSLGLMLGF